MPKHQNCDRPKFEQPSSFRAEYAKHASIEGLSRADPVALARVCAGRGQRQDGYDLRPGSAPGSFLNVVRLPNRVGHFNDEASNNYAQNFAAAHNAGIALNYLMTYFERSYAIAQWVMPGHGTSLT
jgi:hypothetical protein